jgi:hypothetical protein
MTDQGADLHREFQAIKATTDTATDPDVQRLGLAAQGMVLMDMLAAVPGERTRPDFDGSTVTIYDWFLRNGVSEWLPEHFETVVGNGEIVYTSWVWNCDDEGRSLRGWDMTHVTVVDNEPATVARHVPLRAPLDDEVRAAFAEQCLRLVEVTAASPAAI